MWFRIAKCLFEADLYVCLFVLNPFPQFTPIFRFASKGWVGGNCRKSGEKAWARGLWMRIDEWRYNIPLDRTKKLFVCVGGFGERTERCDWILAKSFQFRSKWIFERIPGWSQFFTDFVGNSPRKYVFCNKYMLPVKTVNQVVKRNYQFYRKEF